MTPSKVSMPVSTQLRLLCGESIGACRTGRKGYRERWVGRGSGGVTKLSGGGEAYQSESIENTIIIEE